MVSNRYQILKEIGSGGMGRVFKAIDLFERKTIAIKVILSQRSEHVERFEKEFLLLRQLHHPNIVKVYDFGYSDSGEPYLTMEHVEGKDCKAFFEQLDYSKLWDIMLQICSTLDFLSSKRIVHGDIKPSNILISTSRDGQLRVKFTDFGFAVCGETEELSQWKGTLPYLAPEIIRGERYTTQADLYSLGVLIYEILFGRLPFDEEDPMDLAKNHLERDVLIPEEPPVPAGLRNLILKLLEKDPINRFFSPKDVMGQIHNISGMSSDNSEILLAKSLINSADFVGREKELVVLQEALTNLSQKRNKSVLVTGEAGIGKTRLLEEFATWARVGGFPVVNISLKEHKILEASQDDPSSF
jgi:serine/threonine protein kinase